MEDIYIIGAGGEAHDTEWLISRINKDCCNKGLSKLWKFCGFIDKEINTEEDIPIWDDEWFLNVKETTWCVCAIGAPRRRFQVIQKFKNNKHIRFATLIDPSAIVADTSTITEGSVIFAGAVVTVSAYIGKHTIVGLNATIGHNSKVGDYVSVFPGAHISGNVVVGNYSEIGTGANIIQGVHIGSQAVVGLGSSVIRDVDSNCTVIGNPAEIKFRHKTWKENS